VIGQLGDANAVVIGWNFANHGGSFGQEDADAFVAAATSAIDQGLPLITVLRSGGTRLPEGMHALVGIPRTTLALQRLRQAGLPHISVADQPTMGGVWVSVGSSADVRIAVEGAHIGFSGPRAVTAMTGRDLADGSNTAAAMYDAGLVDAVVAPTGVIEVLGHVLATLDADRPAEAGPAVEGRPGPRDGWAQVVASRTDERPDGQTLIGHLLPDSIPLQGADATVIARLGRLAGRRAVVVALAGSRSTMPSPAGFDLLARAARMAGALDLALVILIDTPGADPHTESDGLSPAIANAMSAVLNTPAVTLCLVHGEGGSGGALAGAVTDVVGVGPYGWFAALAPEGAAATLRTDPDIAARMMNVTPDDLLHNGFADSFVPSGAETMWAASVIGRLRLLPGPDRLQQRHDRWSRRLGSAQPGV
jgi:acetyl-CoA carboxylase carboxyl transferase subunit beta